jgi:hypothetical protein
MTASTVRVYELKKGVVELVAEAPAAPLDIKLLTAQERCKYARAGESNL